MAKLSDVAAINPTRKVKKGEFVPFVEMAALPLSGRDIAPSAVGMRIAKAAGAHFQNGDTLLARITPCLENGKTAQVNVLPEGAIGEGSTEFIVLCGHDSADNDFVYYLCREPEFRKFAISRMEGTSGRQRVAWQSIAGYPVELLLPDVRRGAAEFLATLDDRIDNLRQINATLEAIATALFKSWFVDFDGVPPEDMQESELGLIPKGWRIGTLEDFLVLQRGFDLPAKERTDGDFPVIAASGLNGTHSKAMVKGPGVVTGRSGVLGKVFLELGDFWPLNTTLWVKEFRAASPCYAYELMRGLDFQKFNAGSAVPTLNRNHIHGLPLVIPSSERVKAYEAIAMPLHQRARQNNEQSQTLAQLRDALLPELISGRLRVKQ